MENSVLNHQGNEDFKESQDEIYDAVGDYFENELAKNIKKKREGATSAAGDLGADLPSKKLARPRVMSNVTNIDGN